MNPPKARVAITGIGVKSPAGCDLDSFTDAIFVGVSTAAPITRFDASALPTRIACQIKDFDPRPYAPAKALRRMDPCVRVGLAAALDAYRNAGSPTTDPRRGAVVTGVALGMIHTTYTQTMNCHSTGPAAIDPLTAAMYTFNSVSANICIQLGWHGPSSTISTACAAGIDAITEACRLLRGDEADIVLAGGADTGGITPFMMAAYCQSGALSTRNDEPHVASRAFGAGRDGYVMGEGAAFLTLELLDRALARKAHIYGEVAGSAQTTDGHHLTAPRPDGHQAATCMTAAITAAGLTPGDIRQVNAHGSSTRLGDAMEARALRTVFDNTVPPVTSSKGVLGHMMGASGAAETIVALLSACSGRVPPTAGHGQTAEDCAPIDIVTGHPRVVGPGPVLSNSFGLGGQNASIVITPYRQGS